MTLDPIGATLALLTYEAADAISHTEYGSATWSAVTGLAAVSTIGVLLGVLGAWLVILVIKRFWIPDHLQNPMTLMLVAAVFTIADLLHHEAGLLAVTVMGVALANQKQIDIHRMIEFKESLSILLIAVLFIILSAEIRLESLLSLGWHGPAYAAFLIVVVRPLAVLFSTIGSKLILTERCLLAWLAPRGIVAAAVSSVISLNMGETGATIAPATLIVILTTVMVYGLTAGWLADRLGLSARNPQGILIAGANQIARAVALALQREGFTVVLIDTSYRRVQKARNAGLTCHHANIFSEQMLDDLDMHGIGRLMALTSNDEINTLAAARYRDLFGRIRVYQLPRFEARQLRLESAWQHRLSGRILFSPQLTYEVLDAAFDHGACLKTTPLTNEFDYQSYVEHYGERAWPLYVIQNKQLQVISDDEKVIPKPGQMLCSLILPDPLVKEQEMSDDAPCEKSDR